MKFSTDPRQNLDDLNLKLRFANHGLVNIFLVIASRSYSDQVESFRVAMHVE
jgi:hypothetical protein